MKKTIVSQKASDIISAYKKLSESDKDSVREGIHTFHYLQGYRKRQKWLRLNEWEKSFTTSKDWSHEKFTETVKKVTEEIKKKARCELITGVSVCGDKVTVRGTRRDEIEV